MNQPHGQVSIIIPTRARPDTLVHALRTAVEQRWENVDIIVSDNGGDEATRQVVDSFGDARVRYVTTAGRVSMSDNFEFASSHAKGDWLAVIGDDDGVLPTGLERALEALSQTRLEALGSRSAHYRWPFPQGSGPEVYLTIPASRGFEVRDAKRAMADLLNNKGFFTEYPMLYTGGIISRGLFETIKAKRGRFFHSQIPDIYSGFAVCSMVDQYVFLREPAMVVGHSHHSHGANVDGKQAEQFRREASIPFHRDLAVEEGDPLTFILPALFYECFLQTAYLRGEKLAVDPALQLRNALAAAELVTPQSSEFRTFLSRWSRRFSEHHHLGSDTKVEYSVTERIGARVQAWRKRKRDLVNAYRVDESLGLGGADVFQAAIITEKVMNERPSLAANIAHSIKRVLLKTSPSPAA